MYIFSKKMVERIPNAPTSIERDTFPAMASDGELYRMVLPGFWMDIGQPKDYLTGMCLKLAALADSDPDVLAKGDNINGTLSFENTFNVKMPQTVDTEF